MALGAGQILRGSAGTYKVLNALKAPTVYKAQVLSGSRKDVGCAVVKTVQGELESIALGREYRRYQTPDIASSPFIRTLYDSAGSFEGTVNESAVSVQDPPCLVLEWMETDLRSLPSHNYRQGSHLPRIVSKSVLSALDLFKKHKLIHTDVNINNIFLSNVDGPSPTVKLGDLGMSNGFKAFHVELRRCGKASAAFMHLTYGRLVLRLVADFTVRSPLMEQLARWIYAKAMFGASDKIIEGHTEAWCIAKLQRLVGPLGHCIDYQSYKDEFELAGQLESIEFPEIGKLIKVGTWREELRLLSDPPVSEDLLDFIEYVLVIDMARRPTAGDALQHSYICS